MVHRLAVYVGVLRRSLSGVCSDLLVVLFISRLRGLSQSTLRSRWWWSCRINAASALTSLLSAVTATSCSSDLSHTPRLLCCFYLFIYLLRRSSRTENIKENTKKKAIKSTYHQHTTTTMIPQIFFDQVFWRRNEVELTVDSVFLRCAYDTVFRAISKCTKSQIVTTCTEHF